MPMAMARFPTPGPRMTTTSSEEDPREGEQHVEHPGHRPVDAAAREPGDRPDDCADRHADQGRHHPDDQREPGPVDDAGEHVPPERVCAEEVLRSRGGGLSPAMRSVAFGSVDVNNPGRNSHDCERGDRGQRGRPGENSGGGGNPPGPASTRCGGVVGTIDGTDVARAVDGGLGVGDTHGGRRDGGHVSFLIEVVRVRSVRSRGSTRG